MTAIAIAIPVAVVALALGAVLGYLVRQRIIGGRLQAAQTDADRIRTDAERQRKEILLEGKEEAIRTRNQVEAELKERRAEILRLEQRIAQREESLDRKLESLDHRERSLADRERNLDKLRTELEELRQQERRELERVAGLSLQEARDLLLADIDREVREEASRRVRQMEEEARALAEERGRKVLATAIQRLATDVVSETTVSVVPIPSDDMKGRIIGREGRNIRALEALTGVDLIIDDTPDAVTLSGFDPIRREVARVALTKLVMDGRIHPTRIEEAVEKAKREVEASVRVAGEEAALGAGCPGLHPEVLKLFGRLKYRTSYGQNQLKHAVETAHLAGLIAREIGADVNVARRGGLLHDLGKALDHEVEGTHALIGADFARRLGVSPAVVHCIAAHHEEEEPRTVEAIVVMMADAVSGSRPGARRESFEHYIKRLQALEEVANSFPGVEKAFAIQAGREVRIIVKPEQVDDLESMRLARDISKKIEETMEYPGQIKVTVVRETRAVEYAR